MFKVSIKGIVTADDRHLLRLNERGEYELLGGKLEHSDATLTDRVRQEFLEESGVVIEPAEVREPWFYVFGDQPVLIVPISCNVVRIPDVLFDQDGGRLEWVETDRLDSIAIPKGYVASIRNERPSLMTWTGELGARYRDDLFSITLVVRHPDAEERYQLREACDFSARLEQLGCHGASFAEVRYEGRPDLQIVFDAPDGRTARA